MSRVSQEMGFGNGDYAGDSTKCLFDHYNVYISIDSNKDRSFPRHGSTMRDRPTTDIRQENEDLLASAKGDDNLRSGFSASGMDHLWDSNPTARIAPRGL